MGDECKDCPYQINNITRIEKVEKDVDSLWSRLREVEESVISQKINVENIFKSLDEVKDTLKKIEIAIYNREDPFKKAVFDLGMYALKVGIGGGFLIWAAAKFGGS